MRPDSSGLPKFCHQFGCGQTPSVALTGTEKSLGIMFGLKTCGTGVAQLTSSREISGIDECGAHHNWPLEAALLIAQRQDRARARDTQRVA
jgi:hypothetical protein